MPVSDGHDLMHQAAMCQMLTWILCRNRRLFQAFALSRLLTRSSRSRHLASIQYDEAMYSVHTDPTLVVALMMNMMIIWYLAACAASLQLMYNAQQRSRKDPYHKIQDAGRARTALWHFCIVPWHLHKLRPQHAVYTWLGSDPDRI